MAGDDESTAPSTYEQDFDGKIITLVVDTEYYKDTWQAVARGVRGVRSNPPFYAHASSSRCRTRIPSARVNCNR